MTDGLQKKINDKQIHLIEDGIPSRWDEKSVTHDEFPYIFIIEDLNKLIRKQMKAIDALMYLARPHGYESTDEMYWKKAIRDIIEKELK